MVRLSQDQYTELEKRVGVIVVTSQTSPEEIAVQLGKQLVLQALRNGFVVSAR